MNKTLGQFIFFGSIIAIVTGVVIAYNRANDKGDTGAGGTGNNESNDANFKVLLKNLGVEGKEKNGSVAVMFNGSKNTARFYNNGRFVIFSGKNELIKGRYENGGYTMTPDGEKMVNNSSVFTNLNLLVK